MPFRLQYSRIENSEEAAVESTLEAAVVINGIRVGRVQGLRHSGQANIRPVQEIGTDRVIEFVPGIKNYQGSLQSITIQYGDLVKRLASLTGAPIDSQSYATMLTNFPEFDIAVMRRGAVSYQSPDLYATIAGTENLAGQGTLIKVLQGCAIESFEQSFNANESLIMESVSFRFIDVAIEPTNTTNQPSSSNPQFTRA
jgi:hypothetical protein